MTDKLVDLSRYKKAKDDYEKLLKRNPYTLLTFNDFMKVRKFLEEVREHKLKKSQKSKDEENK